MLRDGTLMQVIALSGLLFETPTPRAEHRKTLREAMLRAIGSSRFALTTMSCGGGWRPSEGDFPDAFSAGLDAMWREAGRAPALP